MNLDIGHNVDTEQGEDAKADPRDSYGMPTALTCAAEALRSARPLEMLVARRVVQYQSYISMGISL